MKIVIIFVILLAISNSRFHSKYPDALRCGSGIHKYAMFFAHQLGDYTVAYTQVYPGEDRYVSFDLNGVYKGSGGHQESRAGCIGKNLTDLQKQGRAFNIQDSEKLKELEQLISKLENKLETLSKLPILLDYEQLKSKWLKQSENNTLENIKKNGLTIGSRWSIRQQGNRVTPLQYEISKEVKEQIQELHSQLILILILNEMLIFIIYGWWMVEGQFYSSYSSSGSNNLNIEPDITIIEYSFDYFQDGCLLFL